MIKDLPLNEIKEIPLPIKSNGLNSIFAYQTPKGMALSNQKRKKDLQIALQTGQDNTFMWAGFSPSTLIKTLLRLDGQKGAQKTATQWDPFVRALQWFSLSFRLNNGGVSIRLVVSEKHKKKGNKTKKK